MDKLKASLEDKIDSALSGSLNYLVEIEDDLNTHNSLRLYAWEHVASVNNRLAELHLIPLLKVLLPFSVRPMQGIAGQAIVKALPPSLCLKVLQHDNNIDISNSVPSRGTKRNGVAKRQCLSLGWMNSLYLLLIILQELYFDQPTHKSQKDSLKNDSETINMFAWRSFFIGQMEEAVREWATKKQSESAPSLTLEDEWASTIVIEIKALLLKGLCYENEVCLYCYEPDKHGNEDKAGEVSVLFSMNETTINQLLDLVEQVITVLNVPTRSCLTDGSGLDIFLESERHASEFSLPSFIFDDVSLQPTEVGVLEKEGSDISSEEWKLKLMQIAEKVASAYVDHQKANLLEYIQSSLKSHMKVVRNQSKGLSLDGISMLCLMSTTVDDLTNKNLFYLTDHKSSKKCHQWPIQFVTEIMLRYYDSLGLILELIKSFCFLTPVSNQHSSMTDEDKSDSKYNKIEIILSLLQKIVEKAVQSAEFRVSVSSVLGLGPDHIEAVSQWKDSHELPLDLSWLVSVWRLLSQLESRYQIDGRKLSLFSSPSISNDHGVIYSFGAWMLGYTARHQQLDGSIKYATRVVSEWFPNELSLFTPHQLDSSSEDKSNSFNSYQSVEWLAFWCGWLNSVMTIYMTVQEPTSRAQLNQILVDMIWRWCSLCGEPFDNQVLDILSVNEGQSAKSMSMTSGLTSSSSKLFLVATKLIRRLVFTGEVARDLRTFMLSKALTSARQGGWMLPNSEQRESSDSMKALHRTLICVGFDLSNMAIMLEEVGTVTERLDVASILLSKAKRIKSKSQKSNKRSSSSGSPTSSSSSWSAAEQWYHDIVLCAFKTSNRSMFELIRDRVPWESKSTLDTLHMSLQLTLNRAGNSEDTSVVSTIEYINYLAQTISLAKSNSLLPLPGQVPVRRDGTLMDTLIQDMQNPQLMATKLGQGGVDSNLNSYDGIICQDRRASAIMSLLTASHQESGGSSSSSFIGYDLIRQQALTLSGNQKVTLCEVKSLCEYLIQPSSVTMVPSLQGYIDSGLTIAQLQLKRLQLIAQLCSYEVKKGFSLSHQDQDDDNEPSQLSTWLSGCLHTSSLLLPTNKKRSSDWTLSALELELNLKQMKSDVEQGLITPNLNVVATSLIESLIYNSFYLTKKTSNNFSAVSSINYQAQVEEILKLLSSYKEWLPASAIIRWVGSTMVHSPHLFLSVNLSTKENETPVNSTLCLALKCCKALGPRPSDWMSLFSFRDMMNHVIPELISLSLNSEQICSAHFESCCHGNNPHSYFSFNVWIDALIYLYDASSMTSSDNISDLVMKQLCQCSHLAVVAFMYLSIQKTLLYSQKQEMLLVRARCDKLSEICQSTFIHQPLTSLTEVDFSKEVAFIHCDRVAHLSTHMTSNGGKIHAKECWKEDDLHLFNLMTDSLFMKRGTSLVLLAFDKFISLLLTSPTVTDSSSRELENVSSQSDQLLSSKRQIWLSSMLNLYRIVAFKGCWTQVWCSFIEVMFRTPHQASIASWILCHSTIPGVLSAISQYELHYHDLKHFSDMNSLRRKGEIVVGIPRLTMLKKLQEIAQSKLIKRREEDYWYSCWDLVLRMSTPIELAGSMSISPHSFLTISMTASAWVTNTCSVTQNACPNIWSQYLTYAGQCVSCLIGIAKHLVWNYKSDTLSQVSSNDMSLVGLVSPLLVALLAWLEQACRMADQSQSAPCHGMEHSARDEASLTIEQIQYLDKFIKECLLALASSISWFGVSSNQSAELCFNQLVQEHIKQEPLCYIADDAIITSNTSITVAASITNCSNSLMLFSHLESTCASLHMYNSYEIVQQLSQLNGWSQENFAALVRLRQVNRPKQSKVSRSLLSDINDLSVAGSHDHSILDPLNVKTPSHSPLAGVPSSKRGSTSLKSRTFKRGRVA